MNAKLVAADGTRRLIQQFTDDFTTGDRRLPDVRLVESKAERLDRMNIDALCETWLIAQQSLQLGLQGTRQRVGKGRQQDPRVRIRPCQMNGPVEGDDGLARARGARDARRPGVVALHP